MTSAHPTPVKDRQIRRDMRVREIVALCPQAADIMAEYGLHCFSCSIGGVESLEEGCSMHGFDDATIDSLIDDINEAIATEPKRAWELTVTPAAARGIRDIAVQEKREQQVLRVTVDETGSFCLEFADAPAQDDLSFSCSEVPDVMVCADPLALQRVGGGTIDLREGRFKLDLPDAEGCACSDASCGCKA